jgi:hypothetical protein
MESRRLLTTPKDTADIPSSGEGPNGRLGAGIAGRNGDLCTVDYVWSRHERRRGLAMKELKQPAMSIPSISR